jgi:thiopurine S-methyltransferase
MDADFWRARWRNDEIAWHQSEYNEALVTHWSALGLPGNARVLVPFCGKSLDMRWLNARGHPVVGAELSELAVDAFFAEAGESPDRESVAGFQRYLSGSIEILRGDFFALTPSLVGPVAGAYDRGGLVALPEPMRGRYANQLRDLTGAGAAILLLTVAYEGGPGSYPPFSVSGHEVEALFGSRCHIDCIEQHTNDAIPPRLAADGVVEATHAVYRLQVH